jgi:diguanylate cyclase (GGDEF)-like protein
MDWRSGLPLALPLTDRGQEIGEIETALASRAYVLRFVPWLEAKYEQSRAVARDRSIARYLVVYLAAKLLFLWCNLQVGSTVFRISMTLRLGIVLPLTLLAVFLILRPFPAWVKGLAAFAPLTAETALVMLLGRLSGSAVSDRYVFAAGVGIFAQTLLMPVPFRYSLRGLAVNLALFCSMCLVAWPGHLGRPISGDYLVFVVGFSLPALYERHSRERSQRRDFLFNELNRLHVQDILNMNARLDRLSNLDSLTGIFNRRYLDAALNRLCKIAFNNGRWIGVLMIDIDYFKNINDTAGHQRGDFCLEEVARVLQNSVRAGVDTVARYGGEEFCAILPDADQQQAIDIAERIRKSIEDAGLPGVNGAALTVSIGVATICCQAGSWFNSEDLVASADRALFTAKRAGRNNVCSDQLTMPAVEPALSLGTPRGGCVVPVTPRVSPGQLPALTPNCCPAPDAPGACDSPPDIARPLHRSSDRSAAPASDAVPSPHSQT